MVWPTKDVGDISDMLQIKGKDDVVYGVQEGDWLKLTREKQKLMNKKRKMKKKRKRGHGERATSHPDAACTGRHFF